jgi:CRISPR-associated endonuclease/helicase Cas3
MHLHLLPVYSKLAELDEIPSEIAALVPPEIRLSEHQLQTYKALTKKISHVVINTAMTGDGKSLAVYLPTLTHPRRHAFAMYPTIELSRDQQRQFTHYASDFKRLMTCEAIWGARLGELARERLAKRRGEILKELFNNCQVILTNPDIFNLVMNYRYGSNIFSDQELPYSLAMNFDDFIFDEFHIFSMPQIVATITAMLFFLEYAPNDAPRFLFSSATPDPLFLNMLDRAGVKPHLINGTYNSNGGDNYRPVLHPSQLTLHKLQEEENVEEWLHRNLNVIVDHWHNASQKPKGAIILNGVVTARRVGHMLADEPRQYGITVGEVTGLVDDERRRAVMSNADLIIGTSTIDVGIDFNISLLIFETLDAGNFLQRLGRLGRVRIKEHPFDRYEAHVLCSNRTPWVYDRFVQRLQEQGIKNGDTIDRPVTLRSILVDQDIFPRATKFLPYAKRWGILQAAHVIETLQGRSREGGFQSLAEALQKRYGAVFQAKDFSRATGRYWHLAGKKHSPQETQQCKAILDEVLSFRGTSPFQTALWDDTTIPPTFIGYDALTLVQNASYHVVDEQSYRKELEQYTQITRDGALEEMRWAMKGKEEKALVLKVTQFFQDRESLLLGWEGLSLRDYTRQVVALKGCVVQAPRHSQDLDLLNSFLRRQWLVCYFTRKEIPELRRQLSLPPYFSLYQVEQSGKYYTAAFGKTALLLEAEMLRFRGKDEEQEAIFC